MYDENINNIHNNAQDLNTGLMQGLTGVNQWTINNMNREEEELEIEEMLDNNEIEQLEYRNSVFNNLQHSSFFRNLFDSFPERGENRQNFANNLLEYKLTKVDDLEETNRKCVICLELFNIGDNIISLPCIHIYHSDCIKKWLLDNYYCPICKYEFNEDDFR